MQSYTFIDADIKYKWVRAMETIEEGTFAGIVADDLASFHDPSVMPEIHKAFEEGRIDDPFVDEDELEDIINGVFYDLDEDNFKRNTVDPLDHFSMKNIERLHLINSKEKEDEDEDEDEFEPENNMSHNKKKIGRNEPCPCGSGLKYKKCCMKG